MKTKFLIPLLILLIILLAGNTYRLQKRINEQDQTSENQIKLVDSLKREIETNNTEARLSLETANLILTKAQSEADSIRKVNKKN